MILMPWRCEDLYGNLKRGLELKEGTSSFLCLLVVNVCRGRSSAMVLFCPLGAEVGSVGDTKLCVLRHDTRSSTKNVLFILLSL